MNKIKLVYFEKEDVLHLAISDDPESGSLELSPNITAELNDKGELIGIEILNASAFIRDFRFWNLYRRKCCGLSTSKPVEVARGQA